MARPVRMLLAVSILSLVPAARAAEPGDEQTVRGAGLSTDGRALLEFFRKQTPSEATRRQTQALIARLGDNSFPVREKAVADLVAQGPVAIPLLRQTVRETADIEVRRRARECLEQIQTGYTPAVAAAAARLVAASKPAGAAAVLLAFLPGPYDETVTREVQDALVAVARVGGKPDPILAASLTHPAAVRRAAAAVTLCRVGDAEHRAAVRPLLRDAAPDVRLAAARALAIAGEREAVPVLVELLTQTAAEHAWQAEDVLYRLADATAPAVPPGGDEAARRRLRDAWRTWWREHGEKIDMARLRSADAVLGYLLIVQLIGNRVVELGRDGSIRFSIEGLSSPLDAEVLPGQRVLIAEHGRQRVTERNLKGEVLWEKKLPDPPIHAQRLPNGFTFIATRKRLLDVDRSGKEVVRYQPNAEIITARRFRDGRIGCILAGGAYLVMDATGRELKRFTAVAGNVSTTNSLTPLPNGHILVVSYGAGDIREYDAAGKSVWQAHTSSPLCALRLPNGNTLVSSQAMVLVEFDRAGKEVGRREAPGHPCQIRQR